MYKETLRGIAGIGVYPAISLVLFCLVFTLMVVRVLRMSRAEADALAALPFDTTEDGPSAAPEGRS